jgi:hypothetical protein
MGLRLVCVCVCCLMLYLLWGEGCPIEAVGVLIVEPAAWRGDPSGGLGAVTRGEHLSGIAAA